MTPGARIAAAIDVLDQVLSGMPAEKALTGWARASRFAGSKDRAAVRDYVFDGLRNLRSYACLGGAPTATGRAVMIGALRAAGDAPEPLFSGEGHAPAPLEAGEQTPASPTRADRWNLPDWLVEVFEADFGEMAETTAQALTPRAPVSLRVNTQRVTRAQALNDLASDGIVSTPNPLADTALTVTEGARKIHLSRAYQDGTVELQDAASQAVVASLEGVSGARVLDYCAGGGGKSLALMAAGAAQVDAHDAEPARMRDISARAARAGVRIRQRTTAALSGETYDLVLVDAPCSGSGAWRRSPEAKWRFTQSRLNDLVDLQRKVLCAAMEHVRPGGSLAYVTCSIFHAENENQAAWLATQGWRAEQTCRWDVSDSGDGFFLTQLYREV